MILGFGIAGIILSILAIVRFSSGATNLQLWLMVGGVFLLFAIMLTFTIVNFLDYKKMKEYPPNKIIAKNKNLKI